eukprot:1178417-Prorocentrum_minimum.AAC.4
MFVAGVSVVRFAVPTFELLAVRLGVVLEGEGCDEHCEGDCKSDCGMSRVGAVAKLTSCDYVRVTHAFTSPVETAAIILLLERHVHERVVLHTSKSLLKCGKSRAPSGRPPFCKHLQGMLDTRT